MRSAESDVGPQHPDERKDDPRDDQVGHTERDAELLGQPLVEDIPRRQAEVGLEEEDDPEGAQEEPGHDCRESDREAAAQLGRRMHASEATGWGMGDL